MAAQGKLFGGESERRTLAEIAAWVEQAPEAWMEEFAFLRAKKVHYKHALLAVWLSLSKDDRGEVKTRDDLAKVLGVAKQTTYDWEHKHPEIAEYAELLLLRRMRGSRLAEVDEMTYQAAAAEAGTHNDRKLYYKRAGVWDENPGAADAPEVLIVLDVPQ